MNRDSIQQLRLDRRLIKRRGWISADELDKEIEALPDASDKVAPPEEESDSNSPDDATAPAT